MYNSHKSPYKQTAFLFQQGNNKQKIFITAKGYSNKVHWNIPFSMIGAFLPGIRPVTPHLPCKCHPVKGLTGSLALLCPAGLEKQTATKYSAFWNLKTNCIF